MDFQYIDVHTHTNFAAFDEDRVETIKRAQDAGVAMINVGTNLKTSTKAVEMAQGFDNVWAIIGLHPIHTEKSFHDVEEINGGEGDSVSTEELFVTSNYEAMLSNPKVVGIGETGLDYYRASVDSVSKQRKAFSAQIEAAIEHDKPLMMHVRANENSTDAYHDALEILAYYKNNLRAGKNLNGNFHFYAGDIDTAQKILEAGFTMSFTGVVTFARMYEKLVDFVPLDRMHAETDAPYVSPHPYRGQRNEPLYVKEVVAKIARIKKLSESQVAEQLVANAKSMFNL